MRTHTGNEVFLFKRKSPGEKSWYRVRLVTRRDVRSAELRGGRASGCSCDSNCDTHSYLHIRGEYPPYLRLLLTSRWPGHRCDGTFVLGTQLRGCHFTVVVIIVSCLLRVIIDSLRGKRKYIGSWRSCVGRGSECCDFGFTICKVTSNWDILLLFRRVSMDEYVWHRRF